MEEDGKSWISRNKINLILLIISVSLVIFLVEFANFLLVKNNEGPYVWPPSLEKTFLPDPDVLQGVEGKSEFTINTLGYRGPLIKEKDNEYRILTIGGSTTENLYLDDTETWPYLTMENLKSTNGKKEVIVMNIGKSGHNMRDHILQLKELSGTYEPDLVILMVGFNDVLLKLSKRWVWKPFDERSYDYTKTFYVTSDYSTKSSVIYKTYSLINGKFIQEIKPQDEIGEKITESRLERLNSDSIVDPVPDLTQSLEDYENNLNRFIEIAKENGIHVLLATQPYLYKEEMSEEEEKSIWMATDFNGNFYRSIDMKESMDKFNAKLLEVCLDNPDIYCLDLEKDVPKTLEYFYDDVHFNEKGSEEVAKKFALYIETNMKEFQTTCSSGYSTCLN